MTKRRSTVSSNPVAEQLALENAALRQRVDELDGVYRMLWVLIKNTAPIQHHNAGLHRSDVDRIRIRVRGERE